MKLKSYIKTFRWMTTVAKGYGASIAICTFLGLIDICLGWCFVWVCKLAVDIASHEAEGNIYYILLLLPLIQAGELGATALSSWISQLRNVKLDNKLKQTILRRLIDSEWRGIEKYHTGDVINRIEGDVSSVVGFVTETLPGIIILLFQLVGSFFMLFWLDSVLAWIVILVSPFFLFLARVYMWRMHRITREVRDSESMVQCQIQESLQYRSVIKTLEQTEGTMSRLQKIMDVLCGQVRKRATLSVLTRLCMTGGFGLSYFLTFSWGVLQIWHGVIGYGTMVAFLQLSGRVQRPIAELSKEIPTFVRCFTAAERLMELMDLPLEPNDEQPLLEGKGLGIRINNVLFSYAEGRKGKSVLNDFSFDFTPGSSVAILGETGVGKTTLIRMLLALIRPERGSVELYDSNESQPLTAFSRRYFTYVPQGNTLLSGTIRSNLQMGNAAATEEQMYEALNMAMAQFVKELPEGLDTPCGERGGGLSEGQAQRIAIARALLRKAPILLLDEATSALDPETEEKVMRNITSQSADQLLILVSHRLSAAAMCDKTLKLE